MFFPILIKLSHNKILFTLTAFICTYLTFNTIFITFPYIYDVKVKQFIVYLCCESDFALNFSNLAIHKQNKVTCRNINDFWTIYCIFSLFIQTLETVHDGEELLFLYHLVEGHTNSSYASHIALQAGLPQEIVKRGTEVCYRGEP